MATQVKSKPSLRYEEDFYAWSREQAALLRDGRFAELDLEHLIEEVDDLGARSNGRCGAASVRSSRIC